MYIKEMYVGVYVHVYTHTLCTIFSCSFHLVGIYLDIQHMPHTFCYTAIFYETYKAAVLSLHLCIEYSSISGKYYYTPTSK